MTDHIRDSIDQLFPPEPPDDPRPDPTPPPDDALPEVPLPCPKCGAPGVCDDGWFVGCSDLDCTLPEMMLADWNRLARAVALLRAVERLDRHAEIDTTHPIFGSLRTDYHLLPQQGSHAWVAVGRNQMSTTCDTIADALIALAAQMEARDETMA